MDLLHYLFDVDPLTIVFVIGLCAVWCLVGVQLCRSRHRQRGIEVDDWHYVLPKVPAGKS
jgi:hypothetical protein